MQQHLLPLFPLQVVLLPGTPLPLHIFEPRYREMFAEILRDGAEFGVVQVKEQGLLRTGCTAAVAEVLKRHEDGRLDVLTFGRRRFRILDIDTERAFLRAEVEYFDDEPEDEADSAARLEALARHRALQRITGEEAGEPDLDSPGLSFLLANVSEDLDFRQTLLEMVSETERLKLVSQHLAQLIEKQETTAVVKRAARQNGHSRHLPGLDG